MQWALGKDGGREVDALQAKTATAAAAQQSLEGGITELLNTAATNKFTLNEKQVILPYVQIMRLAMMLSAH